MTKPTLPSSTRSERSRKIDSEANSALNGLRKKNRRSKENSDVLVEGIKIMGRMLGDGVKKVYDSEIPIMNKLRKV